MENSESLRHQRLLVLQDFQRRGLIRMLAEDVPFAILQQGKIVASYEAAFVYFTAYGVQVIEDIGGSPSLRRMFERQWGAHPIVINEHSLHMLPGKPI